MDFIVNEWLPEYFLPGASKEQKELQRRFIGRLLERKDRIIVLRPSPFMKKIDTYAKIYASNNVVYGPIKFFITSILLNPTYATIISGADPLPEETLAILHKPNTNFISDEYLFHAAIRTETKIIVTTDQKLCNAMKDDQFFNVVMLEDFLSNY